MSNHLPETNDFSIASKLSMVTKGYFKDDFMQYLSPKFRRRSPLINIGYHVRAVVINEGIHYFLKTVQSIDSQIISLGAGFDTTFFRLIANLETITYFELDFDDVVKNKINLIKKAEFLFKKLINPKEFEKGLLSKHYYLISQDMSNINELQQTLLEAGLKTNKPTLFLSECAITYMEEATSKNIIQWGSCFKDVIFLIYEQICPNDGFGQVMMNHFAHIESPLKSVEKYQSKKDQTDRFKDCGYETSWSIGAFEIYKKVVPFSDQERILNLEPFDEWEEWHLTSSHYTLSAGINGIFKSFSNDFLAVLNLDENIPVAANSCEWNIMRSLNLQFYGHSASLIWKSTACLVIGGFGLDSEDKHRRLSQLCLITLEDMEVKYISPPLVEGITWDCMYHTCSVISDNTNITEILLYGGRTSPFQAVNCTPCIVTISKNQQNEVIICGKKVNSSNEFPLSRRRHTASKTKNGTFVFGGIHSNSEDKQQKILGDAWLLTVDGLWIKENNKPPARFSHSASYYDGLIYIVGGIGTNFEPLSDLWAYNITGKVWTQVELSIIPRYSHTSHIIDDNLILIGGVNYLSENQPGLSLINLSTNSLFEYKLPESSRNLPIMLHNHSSFIYSNSVFVIGGGGNCFSFGTSFNKHPITIDVECLIHSTV